MEFTNKIAVSSRSAEINRWKAQLLIFVLIVGASITPEIPVIDVSGVDITVRIEDIILLIIGIFWFIRRDTEKQVTLPQLYKPIILYITVLSFISLTNILINDLSAQRFLFYFAKEIELILLGIVILYLISTNTLLKYAEDVLLFAAIINAGWALYQIVTGDFGPLFYTADMSKARYGTSLLGQPTVLSSGGYYIPAICLAASRFLSKDSVKSVFYAIVLIILFVAMSGAASRASILGAIFGVAVVGISNIKSKITPPQLLLGGISIISGVVMAYIGPAPSVKRFYNAFNGVSTRVEQWMTLVPNALPQAIFGWGVGGVDSVGFREAHNQFIRELITGGVVGLLLFILILLHIVRRAYLLKHSTKNIWQHQIADTAIGTVVGYVIVSLFQDALLNVTLSKMFWIVVGMLGAATIIRKKAKGPDIVGK